MYAIYSVALSNDRLRRQGVDPISRKQFAKKHCSYVIMLLVLWSIQLLHNYDELFNKAYQFKLETFSYFFMFSTGIGLGITRSLTDPYHRFLLREGFWEYFGIIIPQPKQRIEEQPLYKEMAKSLNLELINVILQGITKFANKNYSEV